MLHEFEEVYEEDLTRRISVVPIGLEFGFKHRVEIPSWSMSTATLKPEAWDRGRPARMT
jgi:hypothetical protein